MSEQQTAQPQQQQQPQPQQNEPSPPVDDDSKEIEKELQEYVKRLGIETKVLDDIMRQHGEVTEGLKSLTSAVQELAKKENTPDDIRQKVDEVTTKIEQFQELVDKNDEKLRVMGPWDLSEKVHKDLTEQNEKFDEIKKTLKDFREEYLEFSGGAEGKPLVEATGTLATWLKFSSNFVADGNNRLGESFRVHQDEISTELKHQHDILTEITKHLQDLKENKPVEKQDVEGLAKLITEADSKNTNHHDEFVEIIKKNTKLLEQMTPQTSNLDKIIGGYLDVQHRIEEFRQHLDSKLGEIATNLNDRPVYDPELAKSILAKIEALEKRPTSDTALNEIQEKIKALTERPEKSKEIEDTLAAIKKEVEDLRKEQEPKFQKVTDAVLQVKDGAGKGDAQPASNESERLKEIDDVLESVKSRADEEKARLDEIKAVLDQLNARPQIDNAESLKRIESTLSELKERPQADYTSTLDALAKQITQHANDMVVTKEKWAKDADEIKAIMGKVQSEINQAVKDGTADVKADLDTSLKDVKADLSDIKGRPGLNKDFTDIKTDIEELKKLVGKGDDKSVLVHLRVIEKMLAEKPGETITKDEIENRLEAVQKTVEQRPATSNHDDILKKIAEVEKKIDKIDFSPMSKNVDTIKSDLTTLINRPYVPQDHLSKFMDAVNTDLTYIKGRPIYRNDKPLLTQEYYDKSIEPLTKKIDAIQGEHEKTRATMDLVKNVHEGVTSFATRPAYDPAPVKKLSEQLETFHKSDHENIKLLHDKVDALNTGDSTQLQDLRQQLELYHKDEHEKFNTIHEKVEAISNQDSSVGAQVKGLRNELQDALLMEMEVRKIGAKKLGGAISTLTKLAGGAAILSGITAAGLFGLELFRAIKRRRENSSQQQPQRNAKRHHPRSWNVEE
jgi:DNA repair exonuclease SbcCD ATPase subunit